MRYIRQQMWSGLQEMGRGGDKDSTRSECQTAGCLAMSVCYISCSHFEFFKWLLGPAHTYTYVCASTHSNSHTHTHRRREGLTDLHRAIKGMLTFNLAAVDLCRRIFVRGRSCLSLLCCCCCSLCLACQLRNLFVTYFCSALFVVVFFLVRVFSCCLFFELSACWGQAFPSRQKNPNMFTRDLWRGIFVYVAFLRRRLRLFRRLYFAAGSPRLCQVYLLCCFFRGKQVLKAKDLRSLMWVKNC